MDIQKFTDACSDRYALDFGACGYDRGYAQIDSQQDANWFGMWCSPSQLKICTYCEGEVTVQAAETGEEFAQAIRDLVAFHEEHWGLTRIDPGLNPEMKQTFEALGLGDVLH